MSPTSRVPACQSCPSPALMAASSPLVPGLQKRRAKQAAHMREVERLLAYRRQLYHAMRVGAACGAAAGGVHSGGCLLLEQARLLSGQKGGSRGSNG